MGIGGGWESVGDPQESMMNFVGILVQSMQIVTEKLGECYGKIITNRGGTRI